MARGEPAPRPAEATQEHLLPGQETRYVAAILTPTVDPEYELKQACHKGEVSY